MGWLITARLLRSGLLEGEGGRGGGGGSHNCVAFWVDCRAFLHYSVSAQLRSGLIARWGGGGFSYVRPLHKAARLPRDQAWV